MRVFENRVLRRIFGPKRDEVLGERRILHIEQLNDFCTSQNVIWVIESRRLGWADHVAGMGTGDVHTGFWWGTLMDRDYLADPSQMGG
jgi:hypothetical protein